MRHDNIQSDEANLKRREIVKNMKEERVSWFLLVVL